MFNRLSISRPRRTPEWSGLWVALAVLVAANSASADLVIEVVPASLPVGAGSTGNFFEVDLINNGNSPVGPFTLSAFNVTITTDPAAGIMFTGGDTSTSATYVFSGNSVGFLFGNPGGTNTADVSDLANDLSQGIPQNSTFGLGRIFFDVSGAAKSGTYALAIDTATSLISGSPDFAPLNFTPVNGQVIVSAAVPEPSSMALAVTALFVTGLTCSRRNRR